MRRWCTLFSVTVTRVHCMFPSLAASQCDRIESPTESQYPDGHSGPRCCYSLLQCSDIPFWMCRVCHAIAYTSSGKFSSTYSCDCEFLCKLFSGLRITFQSFGSATNAESDWMCSYFGNTVDFYLGDAWFQYHLAHWPCRLRLFIVLLSPFGIVLSVDHESFKIISKPFSAVKH